MHSSTTNQRTSQQLRCDRLPLAVYLEVAAHLRQVEGVDTKLIMRSLEPDSTEKFDYYQSQVAALEINYSSDFPESDQTRVAEILDYYARRYSAWEESSPSP